MFNGKSSSIANAVCEALLSLIYALGAAGTFDFERSLERLQRFLSDHFLFVTLTQYNFEIINCALLYKIKNHKKA
jgi:hypothetical protein